MSPNNTPEVGRRLTAARLQRGLSQGTVARRAGIAPSYLSRIENGKVQPTFRMVLRIMQGLRADVHEIVEPEQTVTDRKRGACPISSNGRCLLDLIHSEPDVLRQSGTEYYSAREIKLLRRLAIWIRTAKPDRLRAMEVLLDELTQRAQRQA